MLLCFVLGVGVMLAALYAASDDYKTVLMIAAWFAIALLVAYAAECALPVDEVVILPSSAVPSR